MIYSILCVCVYKFVNKIEKNVYNLKKKYLVCTNQF